MHAAAAVNAVAAAASTSPRLRLPYLIAQRCPAGDRRPEASIPVRQRRWQHQCCVGSHAQAQQPHIKAFDDESSRLACENRLAVHPAMVILALRTALMNPEMDGPLVRVPGVVELLASLALLRCSIDKTHEVD